MKARFVRTVLVSLIVIIASARAHAEETPAAAAPPAPVHAPATWSLGGGIAYGTLFLSSPGSTSTMTALLRASSAEGSLERRFSERAWFVVGVSAGVNRHREDVPEGGHGYERWDNRTVDISAGVRRVLTRRSAPIEVSAIVEAVGGVADGELRLRNNTVLTVQDQTAWFAGAQLGLAIDRELTEGLSVRVATPLVVGRYTSSSIRTPGAADVRTTDVSVSAVIAPRLELRLLF